MGNPGLWHSEKACGSCRDALLGDLPYFVAVDRAHQRIVIAFQGTCSMADMFTDAMALPKSGADQWFCVSNGSAITDALHLKNRISCSASSAPRQMYCTAMAFHLGSI